MSDATVNYSTTDFYTAAVLMSEGFKVLKVTTKPGGTTKTFHFPDSVELRDIQMRYVNGTLEGNIRQFKNFIETVKDLLHTQ